MQKNSRTYSVKLEELRSKMPPLLKKYMGKENNSKDKKCSKCDEPAHREVDMGRGKTEPMCKHHAEMHYKKVYMSSL
jgi:hypothetical protein